MARPGQRNFPDGLVSRNMAKGMKNHHQSWRARTGFFCDAQATQPAMIQTV